MGDLRVRMYTRIRWKQYVPSRPNTGRRAKAFRGDLFDSARHEHRRYKGRASAQKVPECARKPDHRGERFKNLPNIWRRYSRTIAANVKSCTYMCASVIIFTKDLINPCYLVNIYVVFNECKSRVYQLIFYGIVHYEWVERWTSIFIWKSCENGQNVGKTILECRQRPALQLIAHS